MFPDIYGCAPVPECRVDHLRHGLQVDVGAPALFEEWVDPEARTMACALISRRTGSVRATA